MDHEDLLAAPRSWPCFKDFARLLEELHAFRDGDERVDRALDPVLAVPERLLVGLADVGNDAARRRAVEFLRERTVEYRRERRFRACIPALAVSRPVLVVVRVDDR